MPQIADSLEIALILSTVAGLAIPLGGMLARVEQNRVVWLENELRHAIIAFGGGALLSAVALVLVPEGTADLPLAPAVLLFMLGGLVFVFVDSRLDRAGGGGSQLTAMLLDFVPEALALGALMAAGSQTAYLLAGIIFLQNLPEGFNAFCEMLSSGRMAAGRVLAIFFALVLLGPLAAATGHLVLAEAQAVLAAIMLFAAGGILYLVFEDIAPGAVLENRYAPPLGAVAGFAFGLAGHMLTG